MIPQVIAIGGAVGAGKSSVARLLRDRLAERATLEPDSGSSLRLLRSDVLRKQLLDIDPLSRLPDKYYENERYGRLIYDTLHEVARMAVEAGDLVLLDATYARRWQRDALEAAVGNARFRGYWLEVSIEERLKRLALRSRDASDAGPTFAAEQDVDRPDDEAQWECIDAGAGPLEQLAEMLAARICGEDRSKSISD